MEPTVENLTELLAQLVNAESRFRTVLLGGPGKKKLLKQGLGELVAGRKQARAMLDKVAGHHVPVHIKSNASPEVVAKLRAQAAQLLDTHGSIEAHDDSLPEDDD